MLEKEACVALTWLDRNEIIDVILVNNEEKIMKSGVMDTGIADYRKIYALVRVTRPKIAPTIKFVIDWKKLNADKFKQDFKMAPWHSCNVFEEVDDNLWMNEILYKDIVKDNLPKRKVKVRSNSLPWMNSKIRKLMNQRYKQLIKANKTKNPDDRRLQKAKRRGQKRVTKTRGQILE